MSNETHSLPVLGRVAVLVAGVRLGLFAGVLAVSFGVFLARSWTIGAQSSDLIVVLVFGGLLSACLYALLYSLVQVQRRFTSDSSSSPTKATRQAVRT
jgi:hypothetical protein